VGLGDALVDGVESPHSTRKKSIEKDAIASDANVLLFAGSR